jgi:chromosome segregation ATPase
MGGLMDDDSFATRSEEEFATWEFWREEAERMREELAELDDERAEYRNELGRYMQRAEKAEAAIARVEGMLDTSIALGVPYAPEDLLEALTR